MGYEVEVKFRVPPARFEALAGELATRGAEDLGQHESADRYLRHPARDFGQTNEALRVRREGTRNAVTYKGPRRPGPTKTREEIEVAIDPDPAAWEQFALLFERLGFMPIVTVRKSRHLFRLQENERTLLVALDRLDGLGTFVEVEALAETEADLPAAQAAVLALGKALGLDEVEPRSYLRMILERDDPAALLPREARSSADA